MSANPNVTRWAPIIVEAHRAAGVSERELAAWTAATLALMHRESRGNPDATHRGSGAHGLFQTLPKFHNIHRGDPAAQIRYYAASMQKYRRQTGGDIPSGILLWASGPGALRKFVQTGEAAHNKVLPHLRNIQDMTAGRGWADYSAWLTGWQAAGAPTRRTHVGRRQLELADTTTTPGGRLASPWSGYVEWGGKRRKVGGRGPGGITGLQLAQKTSAAFLPLLIIGGALLALLTFWGAGK